MDNIRKIVGKNIRYFRQNQNLTQEQLAEMVDVSPSYIGYLERGKKSPSLDVLDRIAKCLGLEPAMLLIPPPDENAPLKKLITLLNGKPPASIAFLQEVSEAYYRVNGDKL